MIAETDHDEAFLLELLNSTPIVDGAQQDRLTSVRDARSVLRRWGGSGSVAEWQTVRSARELLQGVVRGEQAAIAFEPTLAGATYRPAVTTEGIDWTLDVAADRTLAVRAVLAWDGLRRTSPGRLRPCENPDCALFLIDRSKPNNARWCSMAVCGNRMKARRHYERTRSAGS